MAQTSPRKKGRPAKFDRAEALESALDLFVARGYEGTTLEDLQTAMGGITPPSFYNAFGSKEALFYEAVQLYFERVGNPPLVALEETAPVREAMDVFLRMNARAISRPGKPRGCLMVRGAVNCTPNSKGVQDFMEAQRRKVPDIIRRRLDRAVREGELSSGTDTTAIAAFYATVLQGLGLRAGDGASRASLIAAVDGAMAAWEPLVATAKSRS